jgi:hypothetical protein
MTSDETVFEGRLRVIVALEEADTKDALLYSPRAAVRRN